MLDLLCALPFVAGLFAGCATSEPLAVGYVEGEFLLMAPVGTVQVEHIPVRRGDTVEAGTVVARMEKRDAEIDLARAEAAVAQVESQLANLRAGRREEEIRVIEAELASATAQAREAAKEAQRVADLFERETVSQAQVDDAETQLDIAEARVAEMEANLAVAFLPAREQEIAAAEAALAVAQSSRDAAAWRLGKRELTAPSKSMVFEVFRREGEIAGPAAPILSLLPEGAVLLRLYAPEPHISGIAPGTLLSVTCDGCPTDTTATVTYVSAEPEFTPPVIYSLENRQKLVYLVEARPDGNSEYLKPGQIVDVRLGSER